MMRTANKITRANPGGSVQLPMIHDPPPIRLAAFLPRSRANGPGMRSVLWVQGCKLRCAGCFNPDFLPLDGGVLHTPSEVAEMVLAITDTAGVTFSGGEPFVQAYALAEVARIVREAGKSILIFTGFEWEDLQATQEPAYRFLLAQADTLIAGPYRSGISSRHPFLASGNQRLIHLSDRYRDDDFSTSNNQPVARRTELRIVPDGNVAITGFPAVVIREALLKMDDRVIGD